MKPHPPPSQLTASPAPRYHANIKRCRVSPPEKSSPIFLNRIILLQSKSYTQNQGLSFVHVIPLFPVPFHHQRHMPPCLKVTRPKNQACVLPVALTDASTVPFSRSNYHISRQSIKQLTLHYYTNVLLIATSTFIIYRFFYSALGNHRHNNTISSTCCLAIIYST